MNIATLAKITLFTAFLALSLIGTPMQAYAGGPHVKVFNGTDGTTISAVDTRETSEQMTTEQGDQAASERPREAYFVNVDHGTTTQ